MNTTTEANRRFYSRKEICRIFSRDPTTVWRWQRAGKLHPVYVAGIPHYHADDVERLIAEGDGIVPHVPKRPTADAAA